MVGHVAEVSVTSGVARVYRMFCVADCGRAIHPGIVEQQLVGSLVAGLSQAFHNEITLSEGEIVHGNFNTYEMLRIDEVPDMVFDLIQTDEPPESAGEPGVPPAAPAVTNAIFALTGQRVRDLPIRL